ncbi:MAG: XrtA/PEP-CTERM system TPR-repeat protein PrsT [Sedimenticola sp.]
MFRLFKGLFVNSLVLILVACSAGMTDSQHLERAQAFLERGEIKAALIEAKSALEKNPENVRGRFLLGSLHFQLGNPEAAEKELLRARELGVADEAVLPVLSKALLRQGKHAEVLELPQNGISATAEAEILMSKTYASLAEKQLERAAKFISRAQVLTPESGDVEVANAILLGYRKEIGAARDVLDGALKKSPGNARGWSLLGDMEARDNKLEEAEKAYTIAIENTPYDFYDRIKRSHTRIHLKRFAEAQQDIGVLKKRAPEDVSVNYLQGMLYFQQNMYEEAAVAFDLAVRKKSNYQPPLYYLSLSHLRLNNIAQAVQFGEAFLAANTASVSGRKLMATLSFLQKDYKRAEELIRPVVKSFGEDVYSLNLLSNILLKLGMTDEAIGLLRKVNDLDPDSSKAKLRLAAGLLSGGNRASGIEHLESVLESDPQFEQADILLVMHYLKHKELDKALAAAFDYQRRNPDNAMPFNLQGMIYRLMEKDVEAWNAYQKARKLSPGDPAAIQSLAALSIKKENPGDARDYYQEILEHHPNHLSTLIKLAVLESLEDQVDQMVLRLQQAIKAHPGISEPRLILARHYLVNGEAQRVPELLNELPAEERRHPAVMDVLSTSQLARAEYAAAKDTLEKLIEIQPESGRMHFQLSKAYAGIGDKERSRIALDKAVRLSPKHVPARVEMTNILLLEGNIEEAEIHLKQLRSLAPDNPYLFRLESALAKINGDNEVALQKATQAFDKLPDRQTMLFLANLKWDFGDKEGAVLLQEQWVDDHPEDYISMIKLASAYSVANREEDSIGMYRKVLEKNGDDLIALNNLAWKLRNSSLDEALEFAKKANSIQPDSGPILDTLALLLFKGGEIEKASRAIRRALEKSPESPTIQYHSAMIDVQAGRKAAARSTLQNLLDNKMVFPEMEDARKLLEELSPKG